jgi:ADP-ribose pyrophosphatase YjhB (NUDIX family)
MSEFPPRRTLCVGAVILHQNRVLFVRQTYGGLQGRWSLPWGFVDADESPDAAAVRETWEEAGVIAELDGLLGVQNHRSSDGEMRLYLIYQGHHISGYPSPDSRETDQAAYFSLVQLDQSERVFDPFCEWIARRVLRGETHVLRPLTNNPYRPHLAFF